MTRNQFAALCAEFTIQPALALECERVMELIKARDITGLRAHLENNF